MSMPHVRTPSGRTLWRFHGGIHVPDEKALSNGSAVAEGFIPSQLILPLQQHIGEAAKSLVQEGDTVLKGQLIAQGVGVVSANLHAPTSGVVREITPYQVPHASGLSAVSIVLEPDGKDVWAELPEPLPHFEELDPGKVTERIRWAGIVGLGGAAFPASVKLSPGPERAIHTLIINGAECEPYITCDDRLMREQAEKVLNGVRILRHVLDITGECLIGIEDNKPEAIAAMSEALATHPIPDTEIVVIPTLYPSGGEKQLIRILTGKEIPSKGIPAHIGIVCHNVATAAAVANAVLEGRPLISRIVTVTGRGVAQPGNLEILNGTLAAEVIAHRGGYLGQADRLILGGPMMGQTLLNDAIPMTKGGNCLLVPGPEELLDPGEAGACIRCGECARSCPMQLLPQQMYWYARAKNFDKVQEYHLFDCIECGCCAQMCPAHIPLVQYYRYAKTSIWQQQAESRKSESARKRHEAQVTRYERLEREKKERLAKKAAALKKPPPSSGEDDKKAAIDAALQRAKEKKSAQAQAGVAPKNTQNLTPDQQRQVEAAERRRSESVESGESES